MKKNSPLEKILTILEERDFFPHQSGTGWSALCPGHDDNRPSLSLSEGDDGRVLLFCHAGCEVKKVIEELGLKITDLFPARIKPNNKRGRIVAVYNYLNESGQLIFQTCRHQPKDFSQRRHDGAGGWIWNLEGVRRILYKLPELIRAISRHDIIFICEGEKDADIIVKNGLTATSNPLGAGKWREEFCEYLRDAEVIVVADKDPAGRKHAESVAQSLYGIAKSIRIVELPDRDGISVKDPADWFAAGGTSDELIAIVAATPEFNFSAGQSGQVLSSPVSEKFSGNADNENFGQSGQTPTTWFSENFPSLAMKLGEAVLEKTDENGKIVVRDLNEDFLAATLGEQANPNEPTVFVAAENKFYTYSLIDGVFLQRRESVLVTQVSRMLLDCARACDDDCNTKALEFRFRDTANLNGVLKKARGLLEVPDDYFSSDLKEFIPCANGMLRLKDNELLAFNPSYRRRNKLSAPYDPTAECSLFLDTLMRPALDEHDLDLLQRWCGLALIGENIAQKILILAGTAGGGKGTFIRVLNGIIGQNNLASLRTQLLGERFELSRFLGKTLLYGADVPEDFLNQKSASVLKSLTGYDPMTLEFKNSNETPSIIGKYNAVVTCNSRLTVHLEGDHEAWRRRLLIVEYKRPKPEQAIADLDKLILSKESSGVLNWMLAGLDKLRADNWQLNANNQQKMLVDNLLLESDGHVVFAREELRKHKNGQIATNDCFAAYAEFCNQRGWIAQPKNKFNAVIGDVIIRQFGLTQRHDIIDANKKPQRGWRGLTLAKISQSTTNIVSEPSEQVYPADRDHYLPIKPTRPLIEELV